MKKLNWFILKSFLGPFMMTFLIVVFILMMQFLWLYIDDLVGKGLSFWVIMEFLGWGVATLLPLALPLATLLASIMTLGTMGENNELLAMKAAGISLQKILTPLVFVSISISIGAFFISNNLIPISYNKIYTLQSDISRTKEQIKIPTGTFYNGIDGYTLRIDTANEETDMMYGVMVYNHSDRKGNISLTVADSGSIKSTPDKSSLIFTLYRGTSYEEENIMNYKDTSHVLHQIKFNMQEVVIPLENYAFSKSEENKYGNEVMTKNLKILRKDRDSIGEIYNNLAEPQQRRIRYSTSMNYAIQLDTAKNKKYQEGFEIDSLFKWKTQEGELRDLNQAVSALNNAISTVESLDRESAGYTYSLRRIDLESYRKLALSFACFVFFFIGAPLGAIIRKGGLGTPVIISALFFVMYWVIDISAKKLTRDGVMDPFIGAFISTMVLFPIGVFLTWKSTKDSSIFNPEAYIIAITNFLKKLKKKNVKKG